MTYLVDTNVFLDDARPNRGSATRLSTLIQLGHDLVAVPQCIGELWNALTRPASANGIGLSPREPFRQIEDLVQIVPLLPDPSELTEHLLMVCVLAEVRGKQVHDARLAVLVKLHGLSGILTRNGSDFTRFGIQALTTDELLRLND